MSEDYAMYYFPWAIGVIMGLAIGVSVAHYTWSGDAERQQQIHRLRCAQHTTTPAMLEFCVTGDEEAVR